MKTHIGLMVLAGLGPVLFLIALFYMLSRVDWPWAQVQPTAPAFDAPAVEAAADPGRYDVELISGQPSRIEIPSLDIKLAVAEGYFNMVNSSWTLSNDKAHFAVMTARPNNHAGNTFIYGHNLPQVFQRLTDLKLGDLAVVETANGHSFTYRYAYADVTDPTDLSPFVYEGAPVLTLQTCTGLWYQKRLLLYFTLIEVV